MAYYALLDDNNVVVQVFPGVDEYTNGVDWEHHYGAMHQMTCKRTSYNTCGNHHRCLLYTSPSPRDAHESRMPSSA